jgi:hypothetical protein
MFRTLFSLVIVACLFGCATPQHLAPDPSRLLIVEDPRPGADTMNGSGGIGVTGSRIREAAKKEVVEELYFSHECTRLIPDTQHVVSIGVDALVMHDGSRGPLDLKGAVAAAMRVHFRKICSLASMRSLHEILEDPAVDDVEGDYFDLSAQGVNRVEVHAATVVVPDALLRALGLKALPKTPTAKRRAAATKK